MAGKHEQLLTLLSKTTNEAADQALGFALLSDDGSLCRRFAEALLVRATDTAVAYLVRAYHKLSEPCQESLLTRFPRNSGALRLVAKDSDPQARANVIDVVVASNEPKLAYVLTLLLHDPLPMIRSRAAMSFKAQAESLLRVLSGEQTTAVHRSGADKAQDLKQYCLALKLALATFSSHLRTEVVEALMSLGPYLPDDLWAKVAEPRGRIGRAALEIFSRDSRREFAGFVFRALTSDVLGKETAKLIAAERNSDFMRSWLKYGWYCENDTCRKNLARIKELGWLGNDIRPLLETPAPLQVTFIDILMIMALPMSQKLTLLEGLLAAHDELVQERVVTALKEMNTPGAEKLLLNAASLPDTVRFSSRAKRMASEHVEATDNGQTARNDSEEMAQFQQFWQSLEHQDAESFQSAVQIVREKDGRFIEHVRDKLRAGDHADCLKAIMLARRAKLVDWFEEEIWRLCSEKDDVVRASAIHALGRLSSSSAERRLVEALDDRDARVQANAVEALDEREFPHLTEMIEGKLISPNNRIRANVIKAILRPRYTVALRALSVMLDHPDATFRRSGLWALRETMPLHLLTRVGHLARTDSDPAVKDMARRVIAELVRIWREAGSSEQVEAQVDGRADDQPEAQPVTVGSDESGGD